MMANRYMDTFREEIISWNKSLMGVADVQQLIAEIQRSWACKLGPAGDIYTLAAWLLPATFCS
jgi:hypothetical protein